MAEIIVNTAPIGAFQTFQDTELDGVTYLVESAPSAGLIKRYAKSDHLYYTKDSTGAERAFVNVSSAQTLTNKTLTTPTIADFTNATHTHQNAAGGGTLSAAAIASGTLALARGGTNADLSATGGANQFLKQTSVGGAVTVAGITSGDLTTALTTPPAIGGVTPAAGTFTALAGTSGTFTGAVTIAGSSDTPQLQVTGYVTQISVLQSWRNNTPTVVASVSNLGHSIWGSANAPSANIVLAVSKGFTDISTTTIGADGNLTLTYTGTNAQVAIGARGQLLINQSGGNVTSATGGRAFQGVVQVSGTANTVTGVVAGYFRVDNTAAGALTSGYGPYVDTAVNSGGGTFTKFAAFASLAQTAATNNTYVLLGTGTIPSGNWTIHATTTNDSALAGSLRLRGTTAPTAYLHIGAGTTAASTAPLKFTTGTSMTSAEAGAVEFTTDDLFFTITTATARKRLLMADPVGGLTTNRVPYGTTNGRLTDSANFTFDGTTVTAVTLAKPTTFNSDTLAGNALTTNVGRIALTGQTGSISATAIFTPPADGEYIVIVVLTDTTTSTSGATIQGSITYNDENGAQTQSTAILSLAVAGFTTNVFAFHAKTTAAIKYSTNFVAGVGSPQYSLYIDVVRLA